MYMAGTQNSWELKTQYKRTTQKYSYNTNNRQQRTLLLQQLLLLLLLVLVWSEPPNRATCWEPDVDFSVNPMQFHIHVMLCGGAVMTWSSNLRHERITKH